jgi:uncharacterized protein (TIGR02588 family)
MKRVKPGRARSQQTDREPMGADANALSRVEQAAQKSRNLPDIPRVEWLLALLGLTLVVMTVSWIIWRGVMRESAPPQISLQVQSVVATGNGYLLQVQALNQGSKTAADIKVTGTLSNASGEIETAELTFKFLPPGSPKQGGFFFAQDPRTLKLELSAKGYEAP